MTAVTKLTGHFDGTGNAANVLHPVTGHHSSMVTGATGNDLNGPNPIEGLSSLGTKSSVEDASIIQPALQRFSHRFGLLMDLLLHVVPIFTSLDRIGCQSRFMD